MQEQGRTFSDEELRRIYDSGGDLSLLSPEERTRLLALTDATAEDAPQSIGAKLMAGLRAVPGEMPRILKDAAYKASGLGLFDDATGGGATVGGLTGLAVGGPPGMVLGTALGATGGKGLDLFRRGEAPTMSNTVPRIAAETAMAVPGSGVVKLVRGLPRIARGIARRTLVPTITEGGNEAYRRFGTRALARDASDEVIERGLERGVFGNADPLRAAVEAQESTAQQLTRTIDDRATKAPRLLPVALQRLEDRADHAVMNIPGARKTIQNTWDDLKAGRLGRDTVPQTDLYYDPFTHPDPLEEGLARGIGDAMALAKRGPQAGRAVQRANYANPDLKNLQNQERWLGVARDVPPGSEMDALLKRADANVPERAAVTLRARGTPRAERAQGPPVPGFNVGMPPRQLRSQIPANEAWESARAIDKRLDYSKPATDLEEDALKLFSHTLRTSVKDAVPEARPILGQYADEAALVKLLQTPMNREASRGIGFGTSLLGALELGAGKFPTMATLKYLADRPHLGTAQRAYDLARGRRGLLADLLVGGSANPGLVPREVLLRLLNDGSVPPETP